MAEVTKEDLNQAGYKYYAFISYNHRDERWAKALQSRLRRYRLPSVARTELGEDIRIDPVFRYKTNLAVAPLREKIKEELDRSKCLIVICSPNSAKSNAKGEHWVNDEVKRFIALGRVNRIVPVIVAGIPNTGDEHECFPPALRETEISAVELKRGTRQERRHEFLRLVAKLLDLEPMQLIKEDEEELLKERIRRFLCWLPLMLLVLAGAVFTWDAFRPVEYYYADYVDSYGLPKGIFPLEKEDLANRSTHYRFEYHGIHWRKTIHGRSANWSIVDLVGCQRKLQRVVQADPIGRPCKWHEVDQASRITPKLRLDRPVIQEFSYVNDILRQIVERDGYDKFVRRLLLHDRGSIVNVMIEIKAERTGQALIEEVMGTGMFGDGYVRGKVAVQHGLTRNGRGQTLAVRFMDATGCKSTTNDDGISGYDYKLDELGRISETLTIKGLEESRNEGDVGYKLLYSGRNLRRVESINSKRLPSQDSSVRAIWEYDYDANDNNIRIVCYNAASNRVELFDKMLDLNNLGRVYNRCYECLRDFSGGHLIRESLVGERGERLEEYEYQYDCMGNQTRYRANQVCSMFANAWDGWDAQFANGRLIYKKTIVSEHSPDARMNGLIRGNRQEYDAFGNVRTSWNYDAKGGFCGDKYGIAGVIREYNEWGGKTREIYMDAKGERTQKFDERISEIQYAYDEFHNETERCYYDKDGNAGFDFLGVTRSVQTFDNGFLVARDLFAPSGKSLIGQPGVNHEKESFDRCGHMIEQSFYDVTGGLRLVVRRKFANLPGACEIERRLFDNADNEKPDKMGIVRFHTEYDEEGRKTQVDSYSRYGMGGAWNYPNVHHVKQKYDPDGNVVEESYYDVADKPTLCGKGYFKVSKRYGKFKETKREREVRWLWGTPTIGPVSKCVEERYVDTDENEVALRNGVARRSVGFWENGETKCENLYAPKGRGGVYGEKNVHRVAMLYDDAGNEVRCSYFGVDDLPILNKNGFAEVRREYGKNGKELRTSYFGVNGKLIIRRVLYEGHGSPPRISYFDDSGKLSLGKDGYAEMRLEKIQDGKMLRCAFFDENGKLISTSDDCKELAISYDAEGNILRCKCYDTKGKVIKPILKSR